MVTGNEQDVIQTVAIASDGLGLFQLRLTGAIAGAICAFLVFWPKTIRDAAQRLLGSLIFAMLASFKIRLHLGWPVDADSVRLAAAIAAFFGWPSLGLAWVLFEKRAKRMKSAKK